jgi:hypothetical protein
MGGHHYDENDDVSTDAHEPNPMNSIIEIELNEEMSKKTFVLLLSTLCPVRIRALIETSSLEIRDPMSGKRIGSNVNLSI